MKKRLTALILTVCMALGLLSGCSLTKYRKNIEGNYIFHKIQNLIYFDSPFDAAQTRVSISKDIVSVRLLKDPAVFDVCGKKLKNFDIDREITIIEIYVNPEHFLTGSSSSPLEDEIVVKTVDNGQTEKIVEVLLAPDLLFENPETDEPLSILFARASEIGSLPAVQTPDVFKLNRIFIKDLDTDESKELDPDNLSGGDEALYEETADLYGRTIRLLDDRIEFSGSEFMSFNYARYSLLSNSLHMYFYGLGVAYSNMYAEFDGDILTLYASAAITCEYLFTDSPVDPIEPKTYILSRVYIKDITGLIGDTVLDPGDLSTEEKALYEQTINMYGKTVTLYNDKIEFSGSVLKFYNPVYYTKSGKNITFTDEYLGGAFSAEFDGNIFSLKVSELVTFEYTLPAS